eukprot:GHVR01094594.1.p1 GENE.GHVR01094594.1~~GHVR01094594.1.p1  ORF type:complete len:286 (+),score=45.09 GHVR01094594.1:363-1220(+)
MMMPHTHTSLHTHVYIHSKDIFQPVRSSFLYSCPVHAHMMTDDMSDIEEDKKCELLDIHAQEHIVRAHIWDGTIDSLDSKYLYFLLKLVLSNMKDEEITSVFVHILNIIRTIDNKQQVNILNSNSMSVMINSLDSNKYKHDDIQGYYQYINRIYSYVYRNSLSKNVYCLTEILNLAKSIGIQTSTLVVVSSSHVFDNFYFNTQQQENRRRESLHHDSNTTPFSIPFWVITLVLYGLTVPLCIVLLRYRSRSQKRTVYRGVVPAAVCCALYVVIISIVLFAVYLFF